MIRTASAHWEGTGKEGNGNLTTQSTVLNKTQYSYNTRFAEGIGTNPEELIAAAHAGCFTMKLSFLITNAGFTPGYIDTKANLTFEDGTVKLIHLEVKASVQGMDAAIFAEAAADAKVNCPISKLLNTTITMDAALV